MLTTTESYDVAALTALIASAVNLGGDLKAGLFTNKPTISKQSVVGDFTVPGYAGYANQAVVLGDPSRDPLLGISALSAPLIWAQPGAITPVIITGIFYTTTAGNTLCFAELFAAPIALNDALDSFQTILQYVQSPPASSTTQIIR
jgi:hypothetical protein